jgi:hypothetical protein
MSLLEEARTPLLNFVKKHYARVPEGASVNELARMARPFGRDESGRADPLIENFIRNAEAEEQEARAKRQRVSVLPRDTDIVGRSELRRAIDGTGEWTLQRIREHIKAYNEDLIEKFGSAVGEVFWPRINDLEDWAETVKGRLKELETSLASKQSTDEQANRKIEALERELAATRQALAERAAVQIEMQARFDKLENSFLGFQERAAELAEKHAGEIAELRGQLAEAKREASDTTREAVDTSRALKQISDRLADAEATLWSNEEKGNKRIAEFAQTFNQKSAAFEGQLAEAKREASDSMREVVAIRCELKAAMDNTANMRAIEQGLAARQLAINEAKRGPRGEPGKPGLKGERGPAGRDGTTTIVMKPLPIKSWEINREHFSATPIYVNNTRGVVLPLRDLFEEYQLQVGD